MKISLELEDVQSIVACRSDNVIGITETGQIYVSSRYLESMVKDMVQKELQKRSLMDEEKR